MSSETAIVPPASPGGLSAQLRAGLLTWPVMLGCAVLLAVIALALLAPWISGYSPTDIDTSQRLKPPTALHWLGTDALGRDIFARVTYGARQSLVVGLGAVCISVVIGLVIGVAAGYFRLVDAIAMRVMDGLMAIPGILLAIALVSLSGASLFTVLVAISIPEIPRVVRMVRSVILGVRNESYVEAAVVLGTPVSVIMWRHMMPSTVAPLIVQGTYIFASAILTEAVLSFLGAGIPPEIPSWGNIMADGRVYFMMLPGMILYPGILVSLTVLSVNVLGDAVRDALDPRMAKRR
ncbi:ABC transporter permease [Brenneria rubrifaciens]|uniref:ABC transporter permease n=1 Tax=Brenneria rubrifaciens TaxID=55213 RepID=A0A4P8QPS1_9GAMM|nr:ABC transporter permease [Brenneria rubrifaciens]QCR08426.1 ABC transporter permease [Brenneria rubrifaciens]